MGSINKERDRVNAVLPGQHIGQFEILSINPSGRRAIVGCRCGSTHVFSTESLLAGAATCPVLPLTKTQLHAIYAEIRARNRLKETQTALRDWRPSGRRS